MKMDGRRESGNVEDRRRLSGGAATGLGLGGVLIVGIITLLMGGDLGDVVKNVGSMGGTTQVTETTKEFTAEEEALAQFSRQILASTEDVWTAYFKAPVLLLFRPETLHRPELFLIHEEEARG